MFFTLAIILGLGLLAGYISQKIRVPALFGMLLVGIAFGPFGLNWLDASILNISPQLRKIALIIILARAGLSLDLKDLRKVGRPALLMSFVPATVEIIGFIVLAPLLVGISHLEAALMGSVLAAVSPAVVVPKMLKLMEEGYGREHAVPQLILAGSSLDDIFVIVLFTTLLGFVNGSGVSAVAFAKVPLSVMAGIAVGLLIGQLFGRFFKRFHMRDTIKIILFLVAAFLLVAFEEAYGDKVPFSSLVAVMAIGIQLRRVRPVVTDRLALRFNKLWVAAEILLFVLVGATVNPHYAMASGIAAVALIFGALIFRMIGVAFCLIGTPLTRKERIFCGPAYMPKATVQAAIGGIPLAMGLACGEIILTVAVLAILLTAPIGAFLIDLTYKRLLDRSDKA